MAELYDAVKQCAERLEGYRRHSRRLGEQNTKAALIEPVIEALGWDVLDPDEVHREYRRRGSDNPVDYALLLLRTPRLFIEAKGLGENLDDPRWANQTISYAAVAGVEWVALTDGAEWRVYNAHAPVPIEQKLFRSVRLEDDLDAAVELLSLLSKDNMRENRIEELWKGFFVDRQVHAELIDLFAAGEPAPELVALLDRRLSKLTREDVCSSLMRARATFDFPSGSTPLILRPALPPTMTPSAPTVSVAAVASPVPTVPEVRRPLVISGDGHRSAKTKVTTEEQQVSIGDMIAYGRLVPGATLYGTYRGQQHTAELLEDGRVRYRGQPYSPSAAGKAMKAAVLGPDATPSRTSTDGFDFWRTEDRKARDVVTLKEIRRRTANDLRM